MKSHDQKSKAERDAERAAWVEQQLLEWGRIRGKRGPTTYFLLFDDETKAKVQADEWKAGKRTS